MVSRRGFKQIIVTVWHTQGKHTPVVWRFTIISQVPSRLSAGFGHSSQDLIKTSPANECPRTNMFVVFLHVFYFRASWLIRYLNRQIYCPHNREKVTLASVELTLGPKSAAVIGARANKRQGTFPWLQKTFVGERDCLKSLKNVCVGCYPIRVVEKMLKTAAMARECCATFRCFSRTKNLFKILK